MIVLSFTFLTEIEIVANGTLISDPDNWLLLATITSYALMNNLIGASGLQI